MTEDMISLQNQPTLTLIPMIAGTCKVTNSKDECLVPTYKSYPGLLVSSMFTLKKLLFELSYSFLKVLHHLSGLEQRTFRQENVAKFGGIVYFVTMNKVSGELGPWQKTVHVPDGNGSYLSHVWPAASAQSAHAALSAAPSPSAKSYFCGQFRT